MKNKLQEGSPRNTRKKIFATPRPGVPEKPLRGIEALIVKAQLGIFLPRIYADKRG